MTERDYHDIPLWSSVALSDWTDWRWQLRNAITSLDELEDVIHLSEEERLGVKTATQSLKMRISPHLLTLMDPENPKDPLRRQFVPSSRELDSIDDEDLFGDVNADDRFSPTRGLVHRYPSKVLLFPSNYCGAYCRYCFRRKLARDVEETLKKEDLNQAFDYIRSNRQIEEVILSGGDPMVLSDDSLDFILGSLSRIEHVQAVRIHTRLPVTVPYRVTDEFVAMLTDYKKNFPVFFVIHIDTAAEFSSPMREAIARLVDNGFPCFASCPLLKGVNDSETILRELWTGLLRMRIKPYYLFHSDPVQGLRHFLVPIGRGLEIMRNLYDRMSGLAMPLYCFNAPGGGGHVLLSSNYVTKITEGHYSITTFEGEEFQYVESLETEAM